MYPTLALAAAAGACLHVPGPTIVHELSPTSPRQALEKPILLLQRLCTIRSERELCRRLRSDLLFRRLPDLQPSDDVFGHSVFTRNRERPSEQRSAAFQKSQR